MGGNAGDDGGDDDADGAITTIVIQTCFKT
jgi:hypothetical protein